MSSQVMEPTNLNTPEALVRMDALILELSPDTADVNRQEDEPTRSTAVKLPTFLEWYRILRAHHQWTLFHAIRYALWLTR
jgi:hypothetical protein